MRRATFFAALLLIGSTQSAHAGWLDILFGGGGDSEQQPESQSEAGTASPTAPSEQEQAANPQATGEPLSSDVIANGLREALDQGIARAVAELGQEDGFWGDPAARIPLPPALEGPATLISKAGGGAAVDSFRRSLSRAAEQAVPEAAAVFGNALSAMSLRDARNILQGGANAATEYFRVQTTDQLRARLRPVVTDSIDRAGVGPAYDALRRNAGPYAALVGAPDDLEGHVTERALDAVFTRIAGEEARIRAQAGARGSELLERVFGN